MRLFVAGSGTDVGKTYVTASLIRSLRDEGRRVRALKPLASGLPGLHDPAFASSDPAVLLAAQGLALTPQTLDACSPWRFEAPLAPDMAAAAEGRRVTLEAVVGWVASRLAEAGWDDALVEAVGGVMSPITEDATGLDLAAALNVPVLLVCGSYLGAISHGLTALTALQGRGLAVLALIVNESAGSTVGLEETAAAFRRFAPDAPVHTVKRGGSLKLPPELPAG
jgi:dethiobiotin synthetase